VESCCDEVRRGYNRLRMQSQPYVSCRVNCSQHTTLPLPPDLSAILTQCRYSREGFLGVTGLILCPVSYLFVLMRPTQTSLSYLYSYHTLRIGISSRNVVCGGPSTLVGPYAHCHPRSCAEGCFEGLSARHDSSAPLSPSLLTSDRL
jgi:hypothetical protein